MKNYHSFPLRALGLAVVVLVFAPVVVLAYDVYGGGYDSYTGSYSDSWDYDNSAWSGGSSYSSGGTTDGSTGSGSTGSSGSTDASTNLTIPTGATKVKLITNQYNSLARAYNYATGEKINAVGIWDQKEIFRTSADSDFRYDSVVVGKILVMNSGYNKSLNDTGSWGYVYMDKLPIPGEEGPVPAPEPIPAVTPPVDSKLSVTPKPVRTTSPVTVVAPKPTVVVASPTVAVTGSVVSSESSTDISISAELADDGSKVAGGTEETGALTSEVATPTAINEPEKSNAVVVFVQKVTDGVAKIFGGISGWFKELFRFGK